MANVNDAALDPLKYAHEWDYVILGDIRTPGLAKISEVDRAYEWDVKVGKGAFGGTTTFVGRVPAKFSITFTLWRSDHFTEWMSLVRHLMYDPAKISYNPNTFYTSGVDAIDIEHPALLYLDVYSVVIEKIGSLMHVGKGVFEATISFIEYRPPPKVSVVATPAGSTPINGLSPDPIEQQKQAQVQDLTAQAKNAYKGVL